MKNKAPMLPPSQRLLAAQSGMTPVKASNVTLQEVALIIAQSGQPETVRAATRLDMDSIKAGLGYDSAPELERLLIDHIALCWFRVGEAEAAYSGAVHFSESAAKAAYAEKRLSACVLRYTRACEALARVRRLNNGVTVQVNVANQQIVAGDVP
jgi:hypothetical protein